MNKKLDYIDALRGIAILGVIIVHTSGHVKMEGLFASVAGLGAKGVQLFYFVSAFTLFLSFYNRKSEENFPLSNFFLRRFFRIAPLYYFAILYYALQSFLFNGGITTLKEFVLNFTFTHGFSPILINHLVPGGWSISVEMCFYCAVPLLVMKINSFNKSLVFLFITLIIRYFLNQYFTTNPVNSDPVINENYLYWYLPNQLPCFAIGILFYFTTIKPNKFVFKKVTFDWKTLLVSSLLLVLFLVDKRFLGLNFFNLDLVFCIVYYILATFLSSNGGAVIVNRATVLIGKYSYSLYITHFAVLFLLGQLFATNNTYLYFIVCFIVVFCVSLLISKITYNFIELKSQELGRKIIKKRELKFDNKKVEFCR